MDEFGIDLDKVLDEFEEREEGNFSVADGFQSAYAAQLTKEPTSAYVDESRPLPSFPAFEGLDLDLAEADFAPSRWNYDISSQENGRNYIKVVTSAPDKLTMPVLVPDAELLKTENALADARAEAINQTAASEVDVLSACLYTRATEPSVPDTQEQLENRAHQEVLTSPPDIVCSAPDVVSSAMVGVDVVPSSRMDRDALEKLKLNQESKDLLRAETQLAYSDSNASTLESLDVILKKNNTESVFLESTDLQEEEKTKCFDQLSGETLADDLKLQPLESSYVKEAYHSPAAAGEIEIPGFYGDELKNVGLALDGATTDTAAECSDTENSSTEEISDSSIGTDKSHRVIASCPLQGSDEFNDIVDNITPAFSPLPSLTLSDDAKAAVSSEDAPSKPDTLVLDQNVCEGSSLEAVTVLHQKHGSNVCVDGIEVMPTASDLESSRFEAQSQNEEICSEDMVITDPATCPVILAHQCHTSDSSESYKIQHENLGTGHMSWKSEDLNEISVRQGENKFISESEVHHHISVNQGVKDEIPSVEGSEITGIGDSGSVKQIQEVLEMSVEDENPLKTLLPDAEKCMSEQKIDTEISVVDKKESELRNETESSGEEQSELSDDIARNTEEFSKQNVDSLESADLANEMVHQETTKILPDAKNVAAQLAPKQATFVGFSGAELENDFTEEEIDTYLRELDMSPPDRKATEAGPAETYQKPDGLEDNTRFEEEFESAENEKFPPKKDGHVEKEEEENKSSNLVDAAVILDERSEYSNDDKKTPCLDELNQLDMLSSQSESFMLVNGHGADADDGLVDSDVPVPFGNLADEQVESLMKEVEEEVRQMILDGETATERNSFQEFEETDTVLRGMHADKNHGESFEDQAMFVVYGCEAKDGEVLKDILVSETEQSHYLPNTDALLSNVVQSPTAVETGLDPNACAPSSFSNEDVTTSDHSLPLPVIERLDHHGEALSSAPSIEDCPSPAFTHETHQPQNVSASGARQKEIKAVKPASLDLASSLQQPLADLVPTASEGNQVTLPSAVSSDSPSRAATNLLSPSMVSTPTIPLCSNIGLEITQLGKVAPVWLPDAEASKCMECEIPFSFTRRRHHCRACGKVFCHGCSSLRATLQYLENRQDRVCSKCYQDLVRVQAQASDPQPPNQQYQSSVSAPTGVLRKQGSIKGEAKQVMFSDGIRPGGDLTDLDGSSDVRTSTRRSRKADKSSPAASTSTAQIKNLPEAKRTNCLIPGSGLPPVVIASATKGDLTLKDDIPAETIIQRIKDETDPSPVTFAINRDVVVLVKIINLDCCVNRLCWCFTTKGLCTVGQDEIVIILECLPDEKTVPVDILHHLHIIYEMASHGNTVNNLDHTVLPSGSLGSHEVGGFLYIRQTFQCLQKIILPDPPYLFGLLLQKWEMSWARVFPLRLMFRLGAEFRYYPSPLISIRSRKPVYGEIGHTIMNLLADFHNYQYMIPRINGLVIHMEDKRTTVSIPRNRYNMLMKILSNSDDHVIALGASFSSAADSHLVCLQNEDGNYQTQAINIQNRPRKVTGACFIVFNGALKPTSGLRAKSSIVEDGLMVQITSDAMTELKQVLSEMKHHKILCGSIEVAQPDEMVLIEWNNDEKHINAGVKSPIDGLTMYGIDSIRIHSSTDFAKDELTIRWTEVFVLRNGAGQGASSEAPTEVSHLAESLAQACCQALVGHLSRLSFEMLNKIALRVTIDTEQVGYEVGSRGVRLPDFCMNDLDEKLIGIIHGAASQARSGPIILELIFHILHPYIAQTGHNATALAK